MEISKTQILYKLWPFFGCKLFKGACFITSITFFVFFSEKGIDYFKTSVLLSLLFFLPIFFEIITGVVADIIVISILALLFIPAIAFYSKIKKELA